MENDRTSSKTATGASSRKNVKKKRGPGRPKKVFSRNDKPKALKMAALGIRYCDIAKVFGMDPKTLNRKLGRELAAARTAADVQVLQTLQQMASSGKNTSATIFWAKTRGRYSASGYNPEMIHDPSDPQAAIHETADQKLPIGAFNVQRNDKEPNAQG